MKPILFNTEMVRALLMGQKTVTRRVVKPQPEESSHSPYECVGGRFAFRIGERACTDQYKPPYRTGDILYVRETWARIGYDVDSIWFEEPGQLYNGQIIYRAEWTDDFPECRWHPSIHMPKEAARLFLRVTDVHVERLQDINERGKFSASEEGFRNDINLSDGTGKSAAKHFSELWDSTIKKPADRALYGWVANPWVWVIEFERISKETATS